MNDAEKLDWFEMQLRLKTIETMLGPRYRDGLAMTLATLYDEQKIVAMSRRLGVEPKSMLERLEKMRIDMGIERQVVQQAQQPATPTKPKLPSVKPKKAK